MIEKNDKAQHISLLGRLKNASFQFLALALDHNIINSPIYFLMLFLEFYQFIPYIYNDILQVSSNKETAIELHSNLVDILFTITLNSSILNSSFLVLIVVSFSLFVIFVVLFTMILCLGSIRSNYKDFVKMNQMYGWIFKIVSFLLKLICVNGTLILFILFILPFDCKKSDNQFVFRSDTTINCWGGWHIPLVIINILNMIFYITILMTIELMMCENNPKSTLPRANCGAGKGVIVKHVSKILMICFYLFDSECKLYHYSFISQAVLQGFIVYWIFISPPFINQWVG